MLFYSANSTAILIIYILFLSQNLSKYITYRNNCKTQAADNQSIRYEQHQRDIRIQFFDILWKDDDFLVLFYYIFYRTTIRAALPFLWKNFHQIYTKNIDLTSYM